MERDVYNTPNLVYNIKLEPEHSVSLSTAVHSVWRET